MIGSISMMSGGGPDAATSSTTRDGPAGSIPILPPKAAALGGRLARLVTDPPAAVRAAQQGLASLGDPAFAVGQRLVAPGIGTVLGVRSPLLTAVRRGFQRASKGTSSDHLLRLADRLLAEDAAESRWLAIGILETTIRPDPERTWQLLRRAAREAHEWITVDTLAHTVGRGILLEPYRWAELEQLAYSPSRWERRLIGSTIATIPFVDRHAGREPAIAVRGLRLLGELIGDAEPDVQKAIAWAYRSLLRVDPAAVEAALREQARLAAESSDGNRAWVIRDVLPKLEPAIATPLRSSVAGIRRRQGAASTSRAAQLAASFGVAANPTSLPEPPLFDR